MSTLRDLQLSLFEMLKDVDCICKENNIQYSLACGTALGAIRHQGFIPWDDDLDIMFLRPEYDKFLEIAPPLLKGKGYTLQKDFSKTWPMHWSKVRKDNTTFIEEFDCKIQGLHQGIYIDLFPIDNLSDNKFIADMQWNLFHMLVAKGMKKRGYRKTNSKSKKFAMMISPLFPENPIRAFVMQKNNKNTKNVHCFLGAAVMKAHNIFPRRLFDEFDLVMFEGVLFPIIKNYDTYLKICFGDYMKLPPLNKRNAHVHALHFDLNKPYYEYIDEINHTKSNEKKDNCEDRYEKDDL